jgi:hypothetical protein
MLTAQKFPFSLDRNFAQGVVEMDANSHPELLQALLNPTAPLPSNDVLLIGTGLSVSPGNDIRVGPANVGFSAAADAAIGVFSTPVPLRAALMDKADLVSQISDVLAFSADANRKFLMLRWGYDISATAAGSVALGPSASFSFDANAGRKGYYAVVQSVPDNAQAFASLKNLIRTWRLPSQVTDVSRLPAFTTIISEVDGSFGLSAELSFGYEFNWLRAVSGLGLKGDIGLKLQAGLTASLGFSLTGKYAVILSRETDAQRIHMQLYKLRVNDWTFGFDASLTTTPVTPPLPDNFDDLLRAVTGTHGQQIMKLLGQVTDWADPNKPVFGPFVNLADIEAQKLVQSLTGIANLPAAFDDAKDRIQRIFDIWNNLPQTATQLIWSRLPQARAIQAISDIAGKVAGLTEDDLTELIQRSLADIAFLNTTAGQALESLASEELFAALQNSQALTAIQDAGKRVSQILDGGEFQSFLTNLQNAVNTRLNLSKIESVVDQTSFDSLDAWLKARLESFLEQKLVGADGLAQMKKLQAGLQAILKKKDDLYAKALAAIKRSYEFSIHATYQKATTKSALLDVDFDFGLPGSQAVDGLTLALAGKFDQLLMAPRPGVKVNEGVLAYCIRKESHISISLPFFSTESTHVNDAVAQLDTVSEDAGGVILSMKATDLYTHKNDYSSGLTIALSMPAGANSNVLIHSGDSASLNYELRLASANLHGPAVAFQYAPYANVYFPAEFKPQSPGTFSDWITQFTPADSNLGNGLVSLNLSLPPSAIAAWKNASSDKRHPLYKKMSMALQRQFKLMLHDTFFSDLHHYGDVSAGNATSAVLAFCSIPPCSDIRINPNNSISFIDDNSRSTNIYWDFGDRGVNSFQVDMRKAVLFHPATQANLRQELAIAQARLKHAGDSHASFYGPEAGPKILQDALDGRFLDFLFPVEANMVEQARDTGLAMATFQQNKFAKPEDARWNLARFGEKLSEDFNANLKTFAVGAALLPLGTAIYAAAAAALDPATEASITAMLTIQTLKTAPTLTPSDADIERTQRVVHVP